MKEDENGAFTHTVAFISCRGRLTEVLASAARGEMGSKGGGVRVRLSYVDTREFAGISELVDMLILLNIMFLHRWEDFS